jgi:CubicO group peptidase (beta-lactamase class C family)
VAPECDLGSYVLGANGALFSPQGGLRISARDLAKLGQMLLKRGKYRGRPFLSAANADALMRPAWKFDGTNGDSSDGFYCAYGLATQILPTAVPGCRDDLFGDGRIMTGHAGDAYGLRSGLWIDRKRGVGIAYFATNNPAEPIRGSSAYLATEEWLARKIAD